MKLEVIRNEEYLEVTNHITKFGNEFKISIVRTENEDWEDFQLYWYERTDKPYIPNWAEGKWMNLEPIGDGSDVFKPWVNERDQDQTIITLTDLPGINLEAGNSRTLELFICLSNGTETFSKVRLRQELRYNGVSIERQSLVVERTWSDDIIPLDLTEDEFDSTHR